MEKQKKIWGGIGLLLLIMVGGCLSSDASVGKIGNGIHEHGIYTKFGEKNGVMMEEVSGFFHQQYGLNEEKDIFSQLPPWPSYFESQKKQVYDGNGAVMLGLDEEVYKQPEFYPTFETSGIATWINTKGNNEQTIGIGGTPGEQESTITAKPAEFSTVIFVTGAWGSTYYQGMSFGYDVSPHADIQLTFSPEQTIVGPTFPAFDKEWAQKIEITGRIGNVEDGTYTIRVFPEYPNNTKIEEWKNGGFSPYINAKGSLQGTEGIGLLIIHVQTENS